MNSKHSYTTGKRVYSPPILIFESRVAQIDGLFSCNGYANALILILYGYSFLKMVSRY